MLKNNNINELQDLLDSDDELPNNYKEEPDIPAYLDDKRFDAIQFNWLKNNKIKSIPVNSPITTDKPPATPIKPLATPIKPPPTHIKPPASAPKSPVPIGKPPASPAPVRCQSNDPHKENIPAANLGHSNKNLIKKGVLSEEDILCMKSVAARTTDDEELLWFIDFLMYKDLQADYRFLKSCLVIGPVNYEKSKTQYSQIFHPKNFKNCFEFIVK